MWTGLVQGIEHRQNILKVFRILVSIIEGVEQREVLGTQFILQIIYLLGERVSFLLSVISPPRLLIWQ